MSPGVIFGILRNSNRSLVWPFLRGWREKGRGTGGGKAGILSPPPCPMPLLPNLHARQRKPLAAQATRQSKPIGPGWVKTGLNIYFWSIAIVIIIVTFISVYGSWSYFFVGNLRKSYGIQPTPFRASKLVI